MPSHVSSCISAGKEPGILDSCEAMVRAMTNESTLSLSVVQVEEGGVFPLVRQPGATYRSTGRRPCKRHSKPYMSHSTWHWHWGWLKPECCSWPGWRCSSQRTTRNLECCRGMIDTHPPRRRCSRHGSVRIRALLSALFSRTVMTRVRSHGTPFYFSLRMGPAWYGPLYMG